MRKRRTTLWRCVQRAGVLSFAFALWGSLLGAEQPRIGGVVEFAVTADEASGIAFDALQVLAVATLGDTAVQLEAGMTGSTFSVLRLSARSALGSVRLNSALSVDPSSSSLVDWRTTAAVAVAATDLTATLSIDEVASLSNLVMDGALETTCAVYSARARWGVCPVEFWEIAANADWEEVACGRPASSSITLSCPTGFESLSLLLGDIELVEGSLLGIDSFVDVAFAFTPDQKSVSPTLRFTTDWTVCPGIELFADVVWETSPLRIDGFALSGILFDVVVGDAGLVVAESFVDAANGAITGKTQYFERIGVYGRLPSWCGSAGSFELNVYFERPPAAAGTLFGLGLLEGRGEFRVSDRVGFLVDIWHAATSPTWGIKVAAQIYW